MVQDFAFGVQGLGFRVQGSGFMVLGVGSFMVWGLGFRFEVLGFRFQGSALTERAPRHPKPSWSRLRSSATSPANNAIERCHKVNNDRARFQSRCCLRRPCALVPARWHCSMAHRAGTSTSMWPKAGLACLGLSLGLLTGSLPVTRPGHIQDSQEAFL